MTDSKPVIFLSHITEESELAQAIKEFIVEHLEPGVDVFVSSDMISIQAGDRWLRAIDKALKQADILLVLCSRESLKRPWIHFESGAGWIKSIPVIPLCHSGVGPSQLPLPLNLQQAIDLRSGQAASSLQNSIRRTLNTPGIPTRSALSEVEETLLQIQDSYLEARLNRERSATLREIKSSVSLLFAPLVLACIYGLALYFGGREFAGSLLRISAGIVVLPFGVSFRLSKQRVDWVACSMAAVLVATLSGAGSFLVYGLEFPSELDYVLTQYSNILGFYLSIFSGFFLGIALGGWLISLRIGHRPWIARVLLKVFSLPKTERESL